MTSGHALPRRLAAPLGLLGLVAAVHCAALGNPFQYDDRTFIVENEHVRAWPGPLRYLRPPVVDSGGRLRAFYRPVTMLSFHGSFRLGAGATGFRLLDLGLHAAATLLLLALARRLFGLQARAGRFPAGAVEPAAVLAAAVLAAHPLVTQTIDEISKRDTLLAAAFGLGALLAWVAALQRADGARLELADGAQAPAAAEDPRRRGWLGLALLGALLHALALGSKEVAVSTPLLLLLGDRLVLRPARPLGPPRLVVYGLGLGLSAALGVAFVAWAAGGHYPTPLPYEPVPTAAEYVLGQPLVALRYLGLLVSPTGMSAYHEVTTVVRVTAPAFWLAALGLAALVAAAVAVRRCAPEVTLLVFGGVLHLLPTSLARNPIAMDEDRAYLLVALYGLAVAALLARGAALLVRRHGPRAARLAVAAGVVLVAALGVQAGLRHRDWATPVRLWAAAVDVYPTSRSALLFLAGALAEEGRQGERLRVLEAAATAHPRDVRTRLFLAHALAVGDRPADAWAVAAPLAREAPDSAEVQLLVGHLHRAAGATDRAAAAYEAALRLDPGATTACIYLADCRARQGDAVAARRLLECVPKHARLGRGERAIVARIAGGAR